MRKSQSRRPTLAVEGLESRRVLSGGGSLTQELAAVATAFKSFEASYAAEVNTVLFRTTFGPHGATTNTAGNRAAFDAAVGTSLNTLVTKIDSALSSQSLVVQSVLDAAARNTLLSSGQGDTTSLQAVLGHVTTPTPGAFAAQKFDILSDLNIGTAQAELDSAITTELKG